ncbi:MAG: cell division protein FtsQ/DivIB [Candidatus Nanopelagicaceae bacterium]
MRLKREFALGISILIIATLAFLFGWTNIFTVQSVSVNGSPNSQITKQVLQIADIQKGEKLARIEPRAISSNLALAGIDWIESVNISRNWISRAVTINLSARDAIATSGSRYIDAKGVLFTSPVKVSKKLAEIKAKDASTRAAAVDFYLALPTEIRVDATSITASSSKNFQIIMDSGLRINWGDSANSAVKVKIYKALLALPENKKIKQMDVSDPTKPTVK